MICAIVQWDDSDDDDGIGDIVNASISIGFAFGSIAISCSHMSLLYEFTFHCGFTIFCRWNENFDNNKNRLTEPRLNKYAHTHTLKRTHTKDSSHWIMVHGECNTDRFNSFFFFFFLFLVRQKRAIEYQCLHNHESTIDSILTALNIEPNSFHESKPVPVTRSTIFFFFISQTYVSDAGVYRKKKKNTFFHRCF